MTGPIADSYGNFVHGWYSKVSSPLYRTIGRPTELERDDGTHDNVNETIDANVSRDGAPIRTIVRPISWSGRSAKTSIRRNFRRSVHADDPQALRYPTHRR